ncbi:unnamed protein product [Dicrocoelium dendriticum]|nr:unnamed protein product [Dicrocoelium dendriticum]
MALSGALFRPMRRMKKSPAVFVDACILVQRLTAVADEMEQSEASYSIGRPTALLTTVELMLRMVVPTVRWTVQQLQVTITRWIQ